MPQERLSPSFRWAASAGVKASIELYVRRGHDINATDAKGRTLLLIAAAGGHADICHLLIEAGANPSLCDSVGNDALSAAIARGNEEAEAVLRACLPSASVSPGDSVAGGGHSSIADVVPSGGTAVAAGNDEILDLSNWKELKVSPPPPDSPSVLSNSRNLQNQISEHLPVNTDHDWSDVDVVLPDVADLHNPDYAAWLEEVRDLIRFGLSCDCVTEHQLSELALNSGDEENTANIEIRLRFVLEDIGIPVEDDLYAVEVFAVPLPRYQMPYDERNDEIVEDAITFLCDLSRNNDPLFNYRNDIRRLEAATTRALRRISGTHLANPTISR